MNYIAIIGLPGSGKTTLSNLFIKNKLVKGYLSIGSFRNLIYNWIPKKLNDKIREDLAWELFSSSIFWKRFNSDSDDLYVINLCGVNKKEERILEVLKYENCKYIKLFCNKEELIRRVNKRKAKQGWFPYNITFKQIIEQGFNKNTRCLKSDLILHTDRLSINECYEKIFKEGCKYRTFKKVKEIILDSKKDSLKKDKERILAKAKAEGIKVHKGNPKKATSLDKVCSGLKAKYPIKMKGLEWMP